MNKTREQWQEVYAGDNTPLENDQLLSFAQDDIEALHAEIDRLKGEIARTERNRDMWKSQVERQATELTARRKQIQQGKAGDE